MKIFILRNKEWLSADTFGPLNERKKEGVRQEKWRVALVTGARKLHEKKNIPVNAVYPKVVHEIFYRPCFRLEFCVTRDIARPAAPPCHRKEQLNKKGEHYVFDQMAHQRRICP